MGEANEGLRGGFLNGLEGASGELVLLRFRAGSSMVTRIMDVVNGAFKNATG